MTHAASPSDKTSGNFIVLRASAGSGKTYKLVEQYLIVALKQAGNPKFSAQYFMRILALTFTVKAAQEMRNRVLDELEGLSSDPEGSKYFSSLTAKDKREKAPLDAAEIKARATSIHTVMLARFADLSIMTIDAFVNRLVRGFATDLSLEHDFTMEFDTDRILGLAVDRVLKRVSSTATGEDKALTSLLKSAVDEAVEDGGNANIRSQLLKLGKALEQEQMKRLLSMLGDITPKGYEDIRNELRPGVVKAEKAAKEAARDLLAQMKSANILDDFSGKYLPKWLKRVADGSLSSPSPSIKVHIENGSHTTQTASAKTAEAVAMFNDRIAQVVAQICALTEGEEGQAHKTRALMVRQIPLLATLSAIHAASDAVQQEENIRTFSGLNELVSRTIRENPAAYLFERTGERYKHIFIDEFQDTSVMQWQNLSILVSETLATHHQSLVVGDVKQAIYRWRNGDFQQLHRLPAIDNPWESQAIGDAQLAMEHAVVSPPMGDNWRSSEAIVHFNNALYKTLAEDLPEAFKGAYDDLTQEAQVEISGLVEVGAVVMKDSIGRQNLLWDWMVVRIREAISAGFVPRDIVVLLRTNKAVSAFADYLAGLDDRIDAFTEQSLQLGKHPAPLAVVNLLAALNDPLDAGSMVRFVQACGALNVDRGEAWDEAALWATWQAAAGKDESGYPRKVEFSQVLNSLLPDFDTGRLASSPLVEIVGGALHALGADREFPSHAEAMLELATEREAIDHGVPGFLDFWKRKGKTTGVRVMPDRDSIQIMTPHKSKGLEFPVVIVESSPQLGNKGDLLAVEWPAAVAASFPLPGLIASAASFKETVGHADYELERDLNALDNLNVLYVCTTRAVVRLHCVLGFSSENALTEEKQTNISARFGRAVQGLYGCDLTEAPYRSDRADLACPVESQAQNAGKATADPAEVGSIKNPIIGKFKALSFSGTPQEVKSVRPDYTGALWGSMTPRSLGTAIHAVLARVQTSEDVERECGRAWPWSEMSRADYDRVLAGVREVLVLPDAGQWFDGTGQVMIERDVVLMDGSTGRPDRVVIYDDRIEVIDYKTGGSREKDKNQVADYMRALRASSGGKPVLGALLYNHPPHIERVEI
jgi:ATP-dependent exoDNAse (exonuclease V) beta subunit